MIESVTLLVICVIGYLLISIDNKLGSICKHVKAIRDEIRKTKAEDTVC